jgi:dephospho-CoA kinase
MSTERRRGARDGLFIVGLIGRTGSGKSTVAAALARDGAVVVDADAIGHEVTAHDPEVRRALSDEYGADVYGPAGLDRARVAAVVFRDAAARERLNRLVHPRIVERVRARFEALRADGFRGVVVFDAALLLDWGFERECDAVIAVRAPERARIERLATARGWSEEEATRRLAAQRSDESAVASADRVLENGGSRDELERAAVVAVRELRQERGDASPHGERHGASPC